MLALIDGDVIAHKACKSRFSKKAPPGMLYEEIQQMVVDRKAHVFTKEEDRIYLEECWGNFNKILREILDAVFAEDYLMAVKGPLNFRDNMYPLLFNDDKSKAIWGYKANRWKPQGQSNAFVPVLRKLASHELGAVEATGREADDLLRIWANQAAAAGDPYVIVSVDKDLKCIPGKHYNIHDRVLTDVSQREATRFFYQQFLSGDTTDNIPGIPGIGPVKAEKFLYNIHEEDELQEIVVEMYMDAYDDEWLPMLLSNGKMLYLQQHEHDYFQVREWPVIKAILENTPAAKKVGVPLQTPVINQPSPTVEPTPTLSVPPWEGEKPAHEVVAGATIAPSPIPRPSPTLSPRLGSTCPVPGPVPKTPSVSTACVSLSPSPRVFAGKVPSLKTS